MRLLLLNHRPDRFILRPEQFCARRLAAVVAGKNFLQAAWTHQAADVIEADRV
jgi:hypothetical protein